MSNVPHGEPYAGKLHVRFDEGAGVPDEGRPALLYTLTLRTPARAKSKPRRLAVKGPSGRRKKPVGSSSKPYGRLNRTSRAIGRKPTGYWKKPVGLFKQTSRAI